VPPIAAPARTDDAPRWASLLLEAPPDRLVRARSWARLLLPVLVTAYSVAYDARSAHELPDAVQLVAFAAAGASLWAVRRAPLVPTTAGLACWALTGSCTYVMIAAWVVADRRPRGWWAALLVLLAVHPLGIVPDPCAYRAGHVTLPEATAPLLGVALPAALGTVTGEARRLVAARERRLRHEIALATALVATATIEERLRMSREMHDLVGRGLSRIALHTAAIEATTAEPRTAELAARASDAAARAVEDVRHVVGLLRGPDPSARAVPRLLRDEIAEARERGHVVRSSGLAALDALADPARAAVEAAGSEAVHNALKHAPGCTVEVVVRREDDRLRLCVTSGPAPGAAPPSPAAGRGGHGLAIATERLAAVDGTLEARATRDGGFEVVVEVPA